eukprot:g4616.t1
MPKRVVKVKSPLRKKESDSPSSFSKRTRKIAVSRKLRKNEAKVPLSPLRSQHRERNGRVLSRSVLGDVDEFSDMRRVREGHDDRERNDLMNNMVSATRARSRALLKVSKMARATKMRVQGRDELEALNDERSAQMKRISFLYEDAKRVRAEDDASTRQRLDKMRIHERLRFEKEKKVLESFRKIQASRENYKAMAIERVKKKPEELVQARSDMYREIKEEFDIHEKIIPQTLLSNDVETMCTSYFLSMIRQVFKLAQWKSVSIHLSSDWEKIKTKSSDQNQEDDENENKVEDTKLKSMIRDSNEVLWVGLFEPEESRTILQAMSELKNENDESLTVVAGEDTSRFLESEDAFEDVSLCSLGGVATIRLLAGEKLPGVASLRIFEGCNDDEDDEEEIVDDGVDCDQKE